MIRAGFALLLMGLVACGKTPPPTNDTGNPGKLVACQEPRPELCTQQYDPVCAQRDTGIRCVTTPCDSSEWRSYSNACTACADAAVYGYRPGGCEDQQVRPDS